MAVLWLEAGVAVFAGLAMLYELFVGNVQTVANALALFALALGLGAALFFAGRGLLTGRRWGRSFGVTWQLFQLVAAFPFIGSSLSWLGWSLTGVALIGVVALALPVTGVAVQRLAAGRLAGEGPHTSGDDAAER